MNRTFALLGLCVALAACAHHRKPVAPVTGAACRTDTLKVLLGRPGSAVLAAEALSLSGARDIRWIKRKQAVTMDFREDRLNIRLDYNNRAKSFTCG